MLPIFIVVGSPAVGKSTTSHALAGHFSKSIHIATDDIRHMVVSGLQFPSPDWSDELVQQIRLARSNVSHMARSYQQAGYAVVIDDFWDFNLNSDYEAVLAQGIIHKVLLYPNQEAAHGRNLKRAGNTPERSYIDEGIQLVYGRIKSAMSQLQEENWLILDTTELTVENSVSAILRKTGCE